MIPTNISQLQETVDLKALFGGLTDQDKFDLYRKLWLQASQYEVLTSFPLHLDIEVSGVCNLKCEFCFQNGLIERPLGLMTFELFKSIIDEGAAEGLCAIKLQIRGESFLHPRLFEFIEYAKDKDILDVQITTNGTMLDEKRIQNILESRLDLIIFSVDSHHGDSFRDRNKKETYTSIEEAIQLLLERRQKRQNTRPKVRLQASLDNPTIQALRQTESYLRERFPLADIIAVHRIHDFREHVDGYPDLQTNYDLGPCEYIMQRLAVFWNGQVTTCCFDYNARFDMGDVTKQTVAEIWNSRKMMEFRRSHMRNERKDIDICKHCIVSICRKKEYDSVGVPNILLEI